MKMIRPAWLGLAVLVTTILAGCAANAAAGSFPPRAGPDVRPVPAAAAPAGSKIYVANHGKDGRSPSVTVYAADAAGDATPLATLAGAGTSLQQLQFPGVDPSGTLYLSNSGTGDTATSGFVSAFPAADLAADPRAQKPLSRLASPEGIAFDSSGDVYVGTEGAIDVYPPHPTASTAPLRSITGTLAGSSGVYGLAIDAQNRLYVALSNQVEVFAAGASGNAAPIQEFDEPSDSGAGIASCLGIAVDASANIYCANFNNSTITKYKAGSTGTNVRPMLTAMDPSGGTSIDEPFGIFIDGNMIYVSNYGNDSISVFTSATLATGTASRTISGASTGLHSPYGIFVR
jgi:DNA-binding beta-propeller fold protein YncE